MIFNSLKEKETFEEDEKNRYGKQISCDSYSL
jgi:hypothetical protein